MLFSLVPKPWQENLQVYSETINEIGLQLQARADSGERILPDRRHVFRALEI